MKSFEPSPVELAAKRALVKQIGKLYRELMLDAAVVQTALVHKSNRARNLGLLLQELGGRQQINRSTVTLNALPFDFTAAKRFVKISHKMTAPVASADAARGVLPELMLATGLVKPRVQLVAHHASRITPLTVFANRQGAARDHFQAWEKSEPVENWSAERKAAVLAELKWQKELFDKISTSGVVRDTITT